MKETVNLQGKFILDACCGSRMMWFNKRHRNTVFADNRRLSETLCDGRALEINPDIEMDFTQMPFLDGSFKLVVFDPPHLNKLGKNSWMAKKYGVLLPSWETDIKAGFDECMRVLEPYGVLIFKWNESQIALKQILNLIPYKPLFGHTSGRHGKTKWLCFMKSLLPHDNKSTIPFLQSLERVEGKLTEVSFNTSFKENKI